MNGKRSSWYAIGEERSHALRCAACRNVVDLGNSSLDHHSRTCPQCGTACAFLNWKERLVQVVPGNAPAVIQRALRCAQQEFDELEYVEFLVALEELMDDLYSADLARCQ
jgi:hypothetical protein